MKLCVCVSNVSAYLDALKPVAGAMLSCACVSGCLGFTFQLALVQDLLSIMTLHIYCFYVYAARWTWQFSNLFKTDFIFLLSTINLVSMIVISWFYSYEMCAKLKRCIVDLYWLHLCTSLFTAVATKTLLQYLSVTTV